MSLKMTELKNEENRHIKIYKNRKRVKNAQFYQREF